MMSCHVSTSQGCLSHYGTSQYATSQDGISQDTTSQDSLSQYPTSPVAIPCNAVSQDAKLKFSDRFFNRFLLCPIRVLMFVSFFVTSCPFVTIFYFVFVFRFSPSNHICLFCD